MVPVENSSKVIHCQSRTHEAKGLQAEGTVRGWLLRKDFLGELVLE